MHKGTLHRDGSVTFWSVIFQTWRQAKASSSDAEFAAMSADDRKRVVRHLERKAAGKTGRFAVRVGYLTKGDTYRNWR